MGFGNVKRAGAEPDGAGMAPGSADAWSAQPGLAAMSGMVAPAASAAAIIRRRVIPSRLVNGVVVTDPPQFLIPGYVTARRSGSP
ncbi:hypothetical protein GCM10010276_38740 [Streptomyces longisporus]|uniref:Uncharacterized protein n=1 Tax=Streptomyces longisporus TaxID=1948 RepID=A0ABP5ZBC7_STRLO